jgi:hypothetical protein
MEQLSREGEERQLFLICDFDNASLGEDWGTVVARSIIQQWAPVFATVYPERLSAIILFGGAALTRYLVSFFMLDRLA